MVDNLKFRNKEKDDFLDFCKKSFFDPAKIEFTKPLKTQFERIYDKFISSAKPNEKKNAQYYAGEVAQSLADIYKEKKNEKYVEKVVDLLVKFCENSYKAKEFSSKLYSILINNEEEFNKTLNELSECRDLQSAKNLLQKKLELVYRY